MTEQLREIFNNAKASDNDNDDDDNDDDDTKKQICKNISCLMLIRIKINNKYMNDKDFNIYADLKQKFYK